LAAAAPACTEQRIIGASAGAAASRVLEQEQELKQCDAALGRVAERALQAEKLAADREAVLLREAEEFRRGAADREAALLREAEEFRRGAADREAALLRKAEELRRDAADREAALLREAEEYRRNALGREAALLREVEGLRRGAAALQRRAGESEARALDLERQLSRALDPGAAGVRSLARALSGETSTASFAELAAATGGFAASSILGRGGFGPVYRGVWGGQAVAIKRLDPVSLPDSDLHRVFCFV
jgi:hypothetical protein